MGCVVDSRCYSEDVAVSAALARVASLFQSILTLPSQVLLAGCPFLTCNVLW